MFLFLVLMSAVAGDFVPFCDVSFDERKDAYDDSWDISECAARGFCWREGPPDVPWCFHPIEMSAECQAAISEGNRRDCAVGDEEIIDHTCINKGCCWVPSSEEGEPWCFRPAGDHSEM